MVGLSVEAALAGCALAVLAACGAPPPPLAAPAAAAPVAASASAARPAETAMFVKARRGEELFVLAFRPEAGTLEPVGGPLPVVDDRGEISPRPPLEIEYLWHVPGDRVFAFASGKGRSWQVFAGGLGRPWRLVAAGGGEHPHISEDRELFTFSQQILYNGELIAAHQVISWDGEIVHEMRYDEGVVGGFLEYGRRWFTVARDGQSQRIVHGIGEPPRPATEADRWYDEQAGASRDRFQLDTEGAADGSTTLRAFDNKLRSEAGRYRPQAVPDTHSASPYVVSRAQDPARGDRGAVLIAVAYTDAKRFCGDHACVHSWGLDLWTFGRGGSRTERLFQGTPPQPGLNGFRAVIDADARHVLWLAEPSAVVHVDLSTGARRRIETDYELIGVESPRR